MAEPETAPFNRQLSGVAQSPRVSRRRHWGTHITMLTSAEQVSSKKQKEEHFQFCFSG